MLLGKNNVAMVSDFGLSRDVYESGEYENTSGVWKYTLMPITIKLLVRGHPRDQNKAVHLFIHRMWKIIIFLSLFVILLHHFLFLPSLDWIKSIT